MKKNLTKKWSAAALAMAVASGAMLAAPQSAEAQGCGWYVILGCFKDHGGAMNRAQKVGVGVVDTYDYPNFRNGWYCAADGPYSKVQANRLLPGYKRQVRDAYVKSAC